MRYYRLEHTRPCVAHASLQFWFTHDANQSPAKFNGFSVVRLVFDVVVEFELVLVCVELVVLLVLVLVDDVDVALTSAQPWQGCKCPHHKLQLSYPTV